MADRLPQTSTLPSLIPTVCRVLILGSLPGEMSLRKREYYGNPGNRFWGCMQSLGLVTDPRAPYEQRIAELHGHGVGLWDSALTASRTRSADASIRDVTPNPIPDAVREHGVRAIFFNGTTSRAIFDRFYPAFEGAVLTTLPSTSGSNVQWWTRKDEWRAILQYLH
jgi:hypoxanthine-DNA glycosylase